MGRISSIAVNAIRSGEAVRRARAGRLGRAGRRSRSARRALLLGAALAAAGLAGCGGGGSSGGTATVVPDKAADAEVLNRVLGRELAAVAAYEQVLPLLHGPELALAHRFRTQEQEHVDAILKALRGLGAEAEPEEEEVEPEGLKSPTDALDFLYEVESVSIDGGLWASSKLTLPWPRKLLGAIVANQGQHLVLLRQALGAGPLASVPEAFENGTAPPPDQAGDGPRAASPAGTG